MSYPGRWTVFEEEDGTYLFMDNDNWSGNLRITPMKFEGPDKARQNEKVKGFIREELETNKGSKLVKLGDLDTAHYVTDGQQGNMTIYYWVTGDKSTLLICTFSVDTDRLNEETVVKELNDGIESLQSIRIN